MNFAAIASSIAQSVSAQFGGPYVAGKVLTEGTATYDTGGSIATPGMPTERDCMVQIDVASEAMRQSDGYADGDVRFIILADGLVGTLNTDARVRVLSGPGAGTWMVSALERDPVGVYWAGRGRRCPV